MNNNEWIKEAVNFKERLEEYKDKDYCNYIII